MNLNTRDTFGLTDLHRASVTVVASSWIGKNVSAPDPGFNGRQVYDVQSESGLDCGIGSGGDSQTRARSRKFSSVVMDTTV
jgi:hypothetical protein